MGLLDAPSYSRAAADAKFAPASAVIRNPNSFRKGRAKLAAAIAGTAPCEILCVGDSTTEGYNLDRSKHPFPVRLAEFLGRSGLVATPGWVYAVANGDAATFDPRWTGLVDAQKYTSSGPSHITNFNSARPVSFTSTNKGTVLEFIYCGVFPEFTYSIDGGAPVTVPAGGSATAYAKISVTGLADTTHTIALASASATPTYFTAARVCYPNSITVSNAGFGGTRVSQWNSPTSTFSLRGSTVAGTTTRLINPDIALIDLIVNDTWISYDAAAYDTALRSLVTYFKTTLGAATVLVIPPATSTLKAPQEQWDALRVIYYAVADSLDVPLVDATGRTGTFTEANGNGLMADWAHPTAAGYAELARAVYSLLA